MARRCELTGKGVLTGHNVSHANRKTKRRFLPNLCNVTLESEALKKRVRLTVSASALRSVEHRGGLDAYLAKASDDELSLKARRLKRELCQAAGSPTRGLLSSKLPRPRLCHPAIGKRELHQERALQRAEIVVRHQRQDRFA